MQPRDLDYGPAARQWGLRALAEARQFDRQHQLIHQEANRLMDLHAVGQKDAASAGLLPLQAIGDELMVLLQTMEAKLRRGA